MLLDFEATMEDELTVMVGDVVKNVSKGKEEGWLEGELRGKRGIFPANFVKVSFRVRVYVLPKLLVSMMVILQKTSLPTGSACLLNRGQQQRAKKP